MSQPTTVTLQETNDGELFFEVPDEIFDTLGWDEGTTLDWTVVGDSIRISKVQEELLGRSGVAGVVTTISGSDGSVGDGYGEVVGDPL